MKHAARLCLALVLFGVGLVLVVALPARPAAAESAFLNPTSSSTMCGIAGAATAHGALTDGLDSSYIIDNQGTGGCNAYLNTGAMPSASSIQGISITVRLTPSGESGSFIVCAVSLNCQSSTTKSGTVNFPAAGAITTATINVPCTYPTACSWQPADFASGVQIQAVINGGFDEYGPYDSGQSIATTSATVTYTSGTATTTTTAPATTTTTAPGPTAPSGTLADPVPRQTIVKIGEACQTQPSATNCGGPWAFGPLSTAATAVGQGPGWWFGSQTGQYANPYHPTISAAFGSMCRRVPNAGQPDGFLYEAYGGGALTYTNSSGGGVLSVMNSAIWRPKVEFDSLPAGTSGADWCRANDPEFGIDTIGPPAVDCYREFIGNNKVRLRARIGNPSTKAIDDVSLSVPWEPGKRSGLVAEFDMPAQVVAMPSTGWRGLCLVERTVQIPETSRQWVDNTIITIGDVSPQDLQNFQMEFGYDNAPPNSSFAGPGVVTGTSALVAWLAKAGGAAVSVSAGTVATATGAAVAGWTLGGVAAGGIAHWTGDDPWFCQFNPGYRLARDGYCSEVMEQAQLQRSQVGLQDENGEWITTTTMRPWKKAWTATEVVINPGKPSVGPRRTTAIAKPQLSNPQQTGLSQSLSQQAGTDRAAVQTAAPNPTISNPGVQTPTNTDLDTRASDPAPVTEPNGDTGEEASGCWSWNPLSWFKGLACFVKWLLLPTPATTNRLGQLWAGLSDKAPFSFVTILGFPAAQFQAMTGTLFASVSSGECLNFSAMGSAEQPIICAGSPDNPAAYNPVPASIFAPARQIMLLMVRLGLVVLLLHYLQKVFN